MRDRKSLLSFLLAIAILGFSLLACAGGGKPSVDEAVMARSLDDDYKPLEETTEFYPDETFYCSAKVSNLEKGTKVKAKWFYGEEFIDEYTYTTEESGSGYVGFHVTPEETWPIGDYKVEIYLEGELVETLAFSVVPPKGATPSQVKRAITCKAIDEEHRPLEPSTTFAPTDVVHCSVNADLGLYSRLVAKWYFEGQLQEDFITTLVMQENVSDTYIDFYLEPQPQLAEGEYTVETYLDGKLAKGVDFTVERPEFAFGPIIFAQGVTEDNQPINPTSAFPAGTTEIYALFDYLGMVDGMEWGMKWYLEGEEDLSKTQVWDAGESGTFWLRYYNEDGLTSGNCKLELYVQERLVQSGTFVVEAKPTPEADWKSYTSQALGFSIQYPPDWTVTEEEAQVRFEATPDIGLFVQAIPGVEVSAQEVAEMVIDLLREDYPDLETTYMGSLSTEVGEWWEIDVVYIEESSKISLVLLSIVQEGTAYLIGAVAPEQEFDQWLNDFVAIVNSLRLLP